MRAQSIRRSRDFRRVVDEGRAVRRPHMTVFVLARRDREASRVGLAVRVRPPSAVRRNRVRRRLRAALGLCLPPTDVDVVVRAGEGILGESFADLVEELRGALAEGLPQERSA